jgi:DNA-binding transcriptional LysR family regulator
LDPRLCIGNLTEERYAVRPWRLSRAGEKLELRPEGPLHFNSGADQLAAARAGMGVACVLDLVADASLSDGSLRQVYPEWTGEESRTLYVVIPKSRVGSAKVKAFTDFLSELTARRRPAPRDQMVAVKRPRRQ